MFDIPFHRVSCIPYRRVEICAPIRPPSPDALEAEGMVAVEQAKAPICWIGLGEDSLKADATLHLI